MSKLFAALCAIALALGSISTQAGESDKKPTMQTPTDKKVQKGTEAAKALKSAPADLQPKPAVEVGDFWTPRERAMLNPTDPRYLPKDNKKANPTPSAESKPAP
jgi:hypothetical protein